MKWVALASLVLATFFLLGPFRLDIAWRSSTIFPPGLTASSIFYWTLLLMAALFGGISLRS